MPLRGLFYKSVRRRRSGIGQAVIVGLHRDNLRGRLRPRWLLLRNCGNGKNDAAVDRINLQHPEIQIHRLVDDVRGAVDRIAEVELAHRHEALDVVADVDDDALVHQAYDLAAQLGSDRISLADLEPRILGRLLESERDALVLRIDIQNQHVDRITLLQNFRRMLDSLRPRHVRDVNQTIYSRLDLNEGTKTRKVADLAVETCADRILLRQHHPRILLRLLHAEGDLLLVRIDLEHDRLDRLTNRHQLRRVANVARPAHLADVDEAFDARLQLDECAVVRYRNDLTGDSRTNRILLGHVLPRIALELLEAERDALAIPVDVENLDLELLTDVNHLRRVLNAAVRHVGDVEQAVDAAEIDECTEVGDVLDDAFAHLILLQLLHQLLALARPLLLEDDAARDDDVPPALVQLDDLEIERLAKKLVDVRNATQRDLRSGEERVHSHEIYDDATLDLLVERTAHRLVVFVSDADALPHTHEVRFLLREDDGTFLVLEVLEENFYFVTRLEVGEILELFERNRPFGFEPDVEDDHVVANIQHTGLDDFALFDRGHRPVVHLHHCLELVLRIIVLVVELGAQVGKRAQLRFLQVALLARSQRRAGWGFCIGCGVYHVAG